GAQSGVGALSIFVVLFRPVTAVPAGPARRYPPISRLSAPNAVSEFGSSSKTPGAPLEVAITIGFGLEMSIQPRFPPAGASDWTLPEIDIEAVAAKRTWPESTGRRGTATLCPIALCRRKVFPEKLSYWARAWTTDAGETSNKLGGSAAEWVKSLNR